MDSATLPLRARARLSSIFLSGGEITIRSDTLFLPQHAIRHQCNSALVRKGEAFPVRGGI